MNTNVALHRVGKGIVAADKARSSKTISVIPVDNIQEELKGVKDFKEVITNHLEDSSGAKDPSEVERGITIPAEWYNLTDNNRITAPDVVMGEVVELWRVGSTSLYLWSMGDSVADFRKTEVISKVYSNKKDHDSSALCSSNALITSIDTEEQIMYVSTPSNRGGPSSVFSLDWGRGELKYALDTGNHFLFSDARELMKAKIPTVILDASHTTLTGTLTVNGNTTLRGDLLLKGKPKCANTRKIQAHKGHWYG